MKLRVVVLGAGFGGLELTSILSETIGHDLDLVLIDKNESFHFGFSKFDVMFGQKSINEVRLPYRHIQKEGVSFRQEKILTINPESRIVVTDQNTYTCDILVIALGAEYDFNYTPGLAEGGYEFYTLEGAVRLYHFLPTFKGGNIIIGASSAPFKCPPAPCEAALLLHDYLMKHRLREKSTISIVLPFDSLIPSSPDTSEALTHAFAQRHINFISNRSIKLIKPSHQVAVLDDGTEMNFDLFLGIPKHRVPAVVEKSGMTQNGWIPVNPRNLKTQFPNVYAFGDVADVGIPKAGVFAESAARTAALSIIAEHGGGEHDIPFAGDGSCYIEFGSGQVGRVDVNSFSGPQPTGIFTHPSDMSLQEKKLFGTNREARWFGLKPLHDSYQKEIIGKLNPESPESKL